MKCKFGLAATLVLGSLFFGSSTTHAGWGLLGGSHGGGSSGGSSGYSSYAGGSSGYAAAAYGSSGGAVARRASYGSSGYSAAYGSSGYSAAYGSSGYSAAYGSSGYAAAYGGSSGAPGVLHRIHDHLATKIANHRARRAYYGSSGVSYGGSSGGSSGYSSYSASTGGSSGYSTYRATGGSSGSAVSYGSSGYSSSYRASSYGSTGSSYGSTGSGVYYGASTRNNTASTMLASADTDADAVYLSVSVPAAAKLFVNGKETQSKGAVRQFVSRGLVPGKSYKFEVQAQIESTDGQVLTEDKSLIVTAGQREQLQFAFSGSESAVETALTLQVPADAVVTLAGNQTKATGESRTFRTNTLKPGQMWDAYEVEVKLGEQVKRHTVRLVAGDKLNLTFNFDDSTEDRIASR